MFGNQKGKVQPNPTLTMTRLPMSCAVKGREENWVKKEIEHEESDFGQKNNSDQGSIIKESL